MTKELIVNEKSKGLALPVAELVGMDLEDIQDLDFLSVPVIVNDGDMFKVKGTFDWEINSKDGFDAIVLSVKPYAYYRCNDPKHPEKGFYTYDKETMRNGDSITSITDQWEAAGASFSIKDYLEVHLLNVEDGPGFNAIAILNISPKSVKRFKAYVNITLKRQFKTDPWSVVTHFALGEQAASGAGNKFRPTEASLKGFITQALVDKING